MDPMLGVSYIPNPPRRTVFSFAVGRQANPTRGTTRCGAVRRPWGNPAWVAVSTGVQGAPFWDGPLVLPSCGQALNEARKSGASGLWAPFGETTSPDLGTW